MNKYVKIKMDHEDTDSVLQVCYSSFKSAYPKNVLSVVRSPDGLLGWAKVPIETPVSLGGAVLDIEEGTNDRASRDCKLWYPPEVLS